MIDQIAALGTDPQALRAHVGTVRVIANGLLDVEIDGTVIPMIPVVKDVGTFQGNGAFRPDRVLVYQLGDSWLVGAILPPQEDNVVPLGMLDNTMPGTLPDGWTSSATSSMVGREFALVEDETLAHSGDRVLTATDPNPFTTGGHRLLYMPPFAVSGGQDYLCQVYYRKTIGNAANSMELFAYTGTSRRKATFDTSIGAPGRIDVGSDLGGTAWQGVGDIITVPIGHTHLSIGVRVTANNALGQGCVHYLDDFILRPSY